MRHRAIPAYHFAAANAALNAAMLFFAAASSTAICAFAACCMISGWSLGKMSLAQTSAVSPIAAPARRSVAQQTLTLFV